MTTLTDFDAGYRRIPAVRAPLFEVVGWCADHRKELRLRAVDRADAERQFRDLYPAYQVVRVMEYHAGKWTPAV